MFGDLISLMVAGLLISEVLVLWTVYLAISFLGWSKR